MASEPRKSEEQEGGEFADFLAEVSQEVAQRVESLDAAPRPQVEERKKTPATPDAGVIMEWPNIADRMIEEIR